MANPRVELNSKGVRQLLRSPEVQADLARRAAAIARTAGPGFESDADTSATRSRAWVWPDTREAREAESERAALTSAIDAGRQ